MRGHSENRISYSENGISNSESCSENTPELSEISENGLFTPRAFFLKLGWSQAKDQLFLAFFIWTLLPLVLQNFFIKPFSIISLLLQLCRAQ